MSQETINERIKFLIEALGMSVRGFSLEIGSSDTNTRNYLDRGSKPGADYLERIVRRFEAINGTWLLTGLGEPFLSNPATMTNENKARIKKTKGNIQSNSGQTVNNITMSDCEQDLLTCQAKLMASETEVRLLRDQLALHASLVASKDETINALRDSLKRPE
jgi:hypothetical protein